MTADERAEAAEVEALGEVVEYLTEWKNTCRQVGIPFTLHDAVRFADEGGVFDRLLTRRLAEARAEGAQAVLAAVAADVAIVVDATQFFESAPPTPMDSNSPPPRAWRKTGATS